MTFGSATEQNKDVQSNNGFDVAANGALIVNRKRATHPAVNAKFTIGAENTNVRIILVQLKDANGNNIGEKTVYELLVLAGASDALATGGSTGISDGGVGVILETMTAKQRFLCHTDATGLSDFDWTDTGTESVRLAVVLPNGNLIISDAFANA